VNRIGLLTGRLHFESHRTMQERLEAEGIKVINNQVQSFSSIFWDPSIELKL
jgi:methylated-DNA-protein-cysteine methyltransferase-like protein